MSSSQCSKIHFFLPTVPTKCELAKVSAEVSFLDFLRFDHNTSRVETVTVHSDGRTFSRIYCRSYLWGNLLHIFAASIVIE